MHANCRMEVPVYRLVWKRRLHKTVRAMTGNENSAFSIRFAPLIGVLVRLNAGNPTTSII